MKKYIISVLIPSLLIYLTGCYSMQEVTKEEFSPKPDYPNLKILTEEREFTFKEGDYIFQNDSIIGLGKSVLLVSNWQPFDGKININDVEKSETIKMSDSLDTTNVFLKTKEKEYVIKYKKDSFYIKNDSIYCKGKYRLVNYVPEPFSGGINIDDAKEIQMEDFNTGVTIALGALIVVVIVGFIALAVYSTWSLDWGK